MKFSYIWLKELYPKLKSADEAARLLTLHSFQVEEVEKKGNDIQLTIDILANRMADASGHLGIARELSAIQGNTVSLPPARLKEDKKRSSASALSVRIEAKGAVPRYAMRVIDGLRVGQSPKWLKERLETCGLRSINVIVDVTNYVMLETGQPLHAFDLDKLRGRKKEIIVRCAKEKERLVTLDDQELQLSASDIVIADPAGPIGLAGIKGGKGSEIDENTKRVALEAANFDRISIRKTARRIGLTTDASARFQHGIDPTSVEYAIDRATYLLAKLAGGTPLSGRIDVWGQKPARSDIPLTITRLSSVLGVSVPEAGAVAILKGLGCGVKKSKPGVYAVTPPEIRNDLSLEEDLIEEVGRIWGYEKIPAAFPPIRGGILKKSERQVFEDQLKERIAVMGYAEAHLSSFTSEKMLKLFGMLGTNAFQLENPTSPESAFLSPLASLQFAKSLADNQRNFDSIRLFMLGRSFIKTPAGPNETRSVMLGISQKGGDGKEEFYTLKGGIDALLESFGISDHWFDSAVKRHSWAHPYRIAEIRAGSIVLGAIGELSGALQDGLKAKNRIAIAELSVEALFKAARTEQEFRGIPKFPAVVRDLSLLVPHEVRIQEVQNLLEAAGGKLLRDADLFDIYEGGAKKSVAFHLVFQATDRTLTDEEVSGDFETITRAAKAKGWEVRS